LAANPEFGKLNLSIFTLYCIRQKTFILFFDFKCSRAMYLLYFLNVKTV
jgi:hypothetical protein